MSSKTHRHYCKDFCGEYMPMLDCADYRRCYKTFIDARKGMVSLDDVIKELERHCLVNDYCYTYESIKYLKEKYGVKSEKI